MFSHAAQTPEKTSITDIEISYRISHEVSENPVDLRLSGRSQNFVSPLKTVRVHTHFSKIRLVRKSFGLDADDWDSDLYGTTDDETEDDEPAEGQQQQQQDHSWGDFGGAPDDTPSSPEIS